MEWQSHFNKATLQQPYVMLFVMIELICGNFVLNSPPSQAQKMVYALQGVVLIAARAEVQAPWW